MEGQVLHQIAQMAQVAGQKNILCSILNITFYYSAPRKKHSALAHAAQIFQEGMSSRNKKSEEEKELLKKEITIKEHEIRKRKGEELANTLNRLRNSDQELEYSGNDPDTKKLIEDYKEGLKEKVRMLMAETNVENNADAV